MLIDTNYKKKLKNVLVRANHSVGKDKPVVDYKMRKAFFRKLTNRRFQDNIKAQMGRDKVKKVFNTVSFFKSTYTHGYKRKLTETQNNTLLDVSINGSQRGGPEKAGFGSKKITGFLNPQKLVESFRLKEGVTLKTRHYVMKNRRTKSHFIDQNGKRRVTKKYFKKKVKSTSLNKSRMRKADSFKRKRTTVVGSPGHSNFRNSKKMVVDPFLDSKTLTLFERIQSMTSNGSTPAQSSRNLKIFPKNYDRFLNGISTIERYRRDSGNSDFSIRSKKRESDELEQSDKEYLMNQKLRMRETLLTIMNRPVDESFTYKNLKHRRDRSIDRRNRNKKFVEGGLREGGARGKEGGSGGAGSTFAETQSFNLGRVRVRKMPKKTENSLVSVGKAAGAGEEKTFHAL